MPRGVGSSWWGQREVRVTATDEASRHWRRSQRCGQGSCVEVAEGRGGEVLVRDSKDPDGVTLHIDRETWRAFINDIKQSRFDPPALDSGGDAY
ncbi:MAG TPA: DUF397 domain-containing protein [Micromonosporaceae bacterium]